MTPYFILVADGARATFFTASMPADGRAVRLEAQKTLFNPERKLPGSEEFSNLKAGRNRAPPSGGAHGYDDHRLRHRDEEERRFARRVSDAAGSLVRREKPSWFVAAVEPRLLGMLRALLDTELPRGLPKIELSEDLSSPALDGIRAALERRGVLPKSQRAQQARRTRPPPLVAPGAPKLPPEIPRLRPSRINHAERMHPILELVETVREFRHFRGEHARESPEGSRRRKHGALLEELQRRFETLLEHWVPDPLERERWRAHAHHGASAPEFSPPETPLYKGRSSLGGRIEFRETGTGEHAVLVDGSCVDHFAVELPIESPLPFGGSLYEETFDSPPEAVVALAAFLRGEVREPPWRWATALHADGIIDTTFGLTERGRRLRRRVESRSRA